MIEETNFWDANVLIRERWFEVGAPNSDYYGGPGGGAYLTEEAKEKKQWCKDNCIERWASARGYWFESEDDAILFKLTWD